MLNTSPNDINSNYLFFYDFVQPRLARKAMMLAGGCHFSSAELLSRASDFFVFDFCYLGDAQAVKYGKMCLLRAAREAGYVGRQGRLATRHREQSLDRLQESGWDQEHAGSDLDNELDRATERDSLDRAIQQWGCQGLKTFWSATKAGMERQEATEAAGLTKVQVTRMLDFLAKKLSGRPRGKGKPVKGDQPGLFSFDPDCQGV